ncbi:MAG: restriction endonuclease subunit S [Magnetococcales bacterium]|nr:restriction endonuclease subunit S [Magnetococcales bacterium]
MIKGWRHSDLNDCVKEIRSGKSVNSIEEPAKSDEIGVLKTSCVYSGKFNPRENKTVIPAERNLVKCPVTAGTIIVSRMNTADLVGASGYVDQSHPNIFLPDRLWAVFPKQGVDPIWLYYVTSSPGTRARLSNNASGTSASMKNISQDVFLSMPVWIPPLPEQRKISRILSTWDEAIEKLEKLIAAKRQRKQGLMQRLLFGRVRFPEFVKSDDIRSMKWINIPADWDLVHIGDVASQVSATNGQGEELPVLSCTKHAGLVDSDQYFGKRIYSEDISGYKVVARYQFTYATNHIEEGSIGYQDIYPQGLVSPMYTVFKTRRNRVYDGFLFKILKTELFRHLFQINTNSSEAVW